MGSDFRRIFSHFHSVCIQTAIDLFFALSMVLHASKTFDSTVRDHIVNKSWTKLLQLGSDTAESERAKLLWVWPRQQCLQRLTLLLRKYRITRILSVGCGSGLLELLIAKICDIFITGLEIDGSWWTSSYCPRTFIKMSFTDGATVSPKLLAEAAEAKAHTFALMFCYFNNGLAFRDYVRHYQGDYIILIGPKDGVGRHTNPLPFSVEFENVNEWQRVDHTPIGENQDFLVIYKRRRFL